MKAKTMIIKAEELQVPKTRRTTADYGFAGSPVTRVVPPAKGKGRKYNRAQQKRRNDELMR